MIQPIDAEEIRKLIEAHGKRESITICMEEAAEYIQALSKMLRITDWEKDYQRRRAALAEETPLGRLGTPQEVAAAILWLCQGDAAFVTGQVIGVGGGFGA